MVSGRHLKRSMKGNRNHKTTEIMKHYILATILTMFGTSAFAQDVDTEIWDALDAAVSDSVIIPEQSTLDIPVMMAGNTTTETKQPAEGPSDGGVHTMTLYLLNGTEVSYDADDLESVTYLPGVGMKVYVTGQTKSVDYLYSQMTKIVYTIEESTPDPTDNNVNANWNITGMNVPKCSSTTNPSFTNQSTDDWSWRLEFPHISTSSSCQRVVKATSQYGITYSLEWDNGKVANRWTCYTMHAGNMESNVSRSDSFKEDPEVTKSPTTSYSGSYSRGHLCPSADRLCSTEQNKQTFFMTNMQPQYSNHNSGVWSQLEGFVRSKWSPNNSSDTLYVVKAATIDNVTLNGVTSSGVYSETCSSGSYDLPVPKYFYMAFLYYEKSTNSYKAFALWTEHLSSNNASKDTVINNRISIDELEQRTGIDFFCNLPDDIEATVEATATYWE